MGSRSSSIWFAVFLSILSGSIGAAFGRRYCGCEPVAPTDVRSAAIFSTTNVESDRAANLESGDILVRETVSTDDDVNAKRAIRITMLEAEVTRLQSELGSVRFASLLVTLAPVDRQLTLAQALDLMDHSDLTKDPELRALFVAQVRPEVALDLLHAESRFLTALHTAYSKGTPEWRRFEWPAHRDGLLNDFFRRLAEAGLSGRAIELYRASIADYL